MNCRRFQNRLYEYVEGTLSPGTRSAADQHLARCCACRQAVGREQQLSHFLSEHLREDTATLGLRPEVQQRILGALERQPAAPTDVESIAGLWNRFARPLTIGASLLLIVAFLLINHFSGARIPETAPSNDHQIHSAVSIQASYCLPICEFRQEGNLVVDTLSCEPIVASESLLTGDYESFPQQSERKMPL